MAELTNPERAYLARTAIVNAMEQVESSVSLVGRLGLYVGRDNEPDLPDEALLELGFSAAVVEGYYQALEDRERARRVMEEDSAYRYLMYKFSTSSETPRGDRRALRQYVRSLLADDEERARAVEESELYARLAIAEIELEEE